MIPPSLSTLTASYLLLYTLVMIYPSPSFTTITTSSSCKYIFFNLVILSCSGGWGRGHSLGFTRERSGSRVSQRWVALKVSCLHQRVNAQLGCFQGMLVNVTLPPPFSDQQPAALINWLVWHTWGLYIQKRSKRYHQTKSRSYKLNYLWR